MAKWKFDLHTHTLGSGHAYSTLLENIMYAKKKGLDAYGFSEHALTMPGTVHAFYFENFKAIPREIEGMTILRGIEANIIDYSGNIDCTEKQLNAVDYVIASLHPPCIEPGNKEQNTRAVLGALANPKVNIIGHLDDSRYEVDVELIVKTASELNKVMELNNSSLSPRSMRMNGVENITRLMNACMQYNCKVILGSDSHFCTEVGNFSEVEKLIETLNFDTSLIVNSSVDNLKYAINQMV